MTVTDANTADLYDRYEHVARVPNLSFRDIGGRTTFSGKIQTVRCFEDNSYIKSLSTEPGDDRVLVVDGGGSLRCALLGDMIAAAMLANGWTGVVIWGAVRDVSVLNALNFGVKALGSTPQKSVRRGQGEVGVTLSIGDVEWRPGDHLYADCDGMILLDDEAAADSQA